MVSPYFWSRVNALITNRWEVSITLPCQTVTCKLFKNDFQVYGFTTHYMHNALSQIGEKERKLELLAGIVRINSREDVNERVIGREIYYRELAAIIIDFDGENGRVRVRSDHPGIHGFPPEPWVESGVTEQDVWEDLLSPRIHWHREAA